MNISFFVSNDFLELRNKFLTHRINPKNSFKKKKSAFKELDLNILFHKPYANKVLLEIG